MSQLGNTTLPPELYQQIHGILQAARQQSYRAVNTAMVEAYWQIGRRIVDHEQGGEARAAYGQGVLAALAARLTEDFGKGFTSANLRNFRQFYLTFTDEQIRYALRSNLTWTHLRQLMRIDKLDARNWYMNEASQQGWSARALDRQIATLYYERLLSSQDKAALQQEASNPTLGLILCSERNEAVAKFSLLAGSQQLFASRYRTFLPSEAELQAELQRDRALLENQREAQA